MSHHELSTDDLAQEIRRIDGNHSLGAGALAEALMPFLRSKQAPTVAVPDEGLEQAIETLVNVEVCAALELENGAPSEQKQREIATELKDARDAVTQALRARAEQREAPSAVVGECATDGCGNPATARFERDGIGSSYCADCYLKVQAVPFNRAAAPTSDGR